MIMEELKLVSNDCRSRMDEILSESWKVFKWQFANKVFVKDIENEAPFQLHFASIIRSIGNMYVLHGETFYVDLETKWESRDDKSEGKKKYIDITCGHCCPEKFYHKVGCSTEPASGTLTGVVG